MSAILEIQETVSTANPGVVRPRPISVREYDRMIEIGLFDEDERIELLNGEIVKVMPKGTKHSSVNDKTTRFFYRTIGDKAIIRNQNPIVLDDLSEPEPDIVLAKPDENEYAERHPAPADILLVMEISDTTLQYDRDVKSHFYARAGIRQYLLLNLTDETVEDYREPAPDGYGYKKTYRRSDSLSLVEFPDVEINLADFFGE